MFDSIVIGSGFAGAVVARELAEKKGQQVLVIDARDSGKYSICTFGCGAYYCR